MIASYHVDIAIVSCKGIDMTLGVTDSNELDEAELTVSAKPFESPVWVDLVTGNAYELPASRVKRSGEKTVYSVPIYDSPVFITERKLLDLAVTWYIRSLEK